MEPRGELQLVTLGVEDIQRIMELETKAFEPAMQASEETVLERFSRGHSMIAVADRQRLVGAIAFSRIRFSPHDLSGFPTTFKAYSTQPTADDADTLCLYSLGVEPAGRVVATTRLLVHTALGVGRLDGMVKAVADGPLPSFAGNAQVERRPAVGQMLERYMETGEMPAQHDFLQDPVLALYHRLTNCQFLALFPNFLPEDTASGGWRVLLYREL